MTSNLNVYQDGRKRNLVDWIQEQGERVYKDVGKRTWRVPPVKFNVQNLSEQSDDVKTLKNACNCSRGSVLGQPNLSDVEANRAEDIVCSAFESLSNEMLNNGTSSAVFLISNFEYDNYLNKLSLLIAECNSDECASTCANEPPASSDHETQTSRQVFKLPKDVAQRGELDILILHQEAGVVLIQTKAVGYSFKSSNTNRSDCIQVAIKKAAVQLLRDRRVMLHVMDDLQLKDVHIKTVVALPNISRQILDQDMDQELKLKMHKDFNLDPDLSFLCEEDFKSDVNRSYRALEMWWKNNLIPRSKGISLSTMQQIAYRTVGLLSTVSVWSFAQPRIEVRDLNDAAWETGNRYTQVVLTSQQVQLLKREDKYFYLWGPPGSGKTLLLSLKGRQWLWSGFNVLILNTRLGSRGRTVGHIIERTINNTKELKKLATRVDLDLSDTEEALSCVISSYINDPSQPINFILDEVVWVRETEKLLSVLKKAYPHSMIWCAGMLPECQPKDFQSDRLKHILRCPPWVQRVLRAVDDRDERCELYHLDSALAGLPTDGPRPHFIIHSEHGGPSVQPYDCSECGWMLCDFLMNELNMKEKVEQPSMQEDVTCKPSPDPGVRPDGTRTCPKKPKKPKKPGEPCCCGGSSNGPSYPRLSFSDAVMPVSVPRAWHHFGSRGYWALSKEALAQDMLLIGSRALCQHMFDAGIPLKVEEAMIFKSDGQNLENNFDICPIGAVHGLEYKLVVCVPSEFALDEFTEINPGIVDGKMAPKVKLKRTEFAELLRGKDQLSREKCNVSKRTEDLESKSDKIRISTHVSDEGLPNDCLYEVVTDSDLLSVCGANRGFHDSRKSSKIDFLNSGKSNEIYSRDSGRSSETDFLDSVRTNEIDFPENKDFIDSRKLDDRNFRDSVKSSKIDFHYSGKSSMAEICQHSESDKCVCKYFRPEELAALNRLNPWDKAYVLMCASRCTSILVLVLP